MIATAAGFLSWQSWRKSPAARSEVDTFRKPVRNISSRNAAIIASLFPRFALRAVAFSGDQNPSGHTVGTFNSIYEKGPYFSYAELFARRNRIALQPMADLKVRKSVSLSINPAFFWRESTSDGLCNVGGGVIASGVNARARFITAQASAQLRWTMTRNLTWFSEFGHFFPSEFLNQATAGRNVNCWTAWLDIRH
jgi:hypothetical protein